jgi:hypothetical protein
MDPVASTISVPEEPFEVGTFPFNRGPFVQELTVTGAPGEAVEVRWTAMAYEISLIGPANCTAVDGTAPILSVPIVAAVPATRDDCMHGGWRTLTDADGAPFSNQGQCIRTVTPDR